jgi:hypothetical protein
VAPAQQEVTFLVEYEDPDRAYRPWLIPFIDGVDLRHLVDPRPTHAGPGGVRFGGIPGLEPRQLTAYYLGRAVDLRWLGRVALLGCSCAGGGVTWADLVGGLGERPIPLGPFCFDRAAYQLALDRAAADLAALLGG